MDKSKRRAIQFLEKEIKTYTALALYFSKKGIKESVEGGRRRNPHRPDVLQGEDERSQENFK